MKGPSYVTYRNDVSSPCISCLVFIFLIYLFWHEVIHAYIYVDPDCPSQRLQLGLAASLKVVNCFT